MSDFVILANFQDVSVGNRFVHNASVRNKNKEPLHSIPHINSFYCPVLWYESPLANQLLKVFMTLFPEKHCTKQSFLGINNVHVISNTYCACNSYSSNGASGTVHILPDCFFPPDRSLKFHLYCYSPHVKMPSTPAVIAASALMSVAGAIVLQNVLSFLHLVFLFVPKFWGKASRTRSCFLFVFSLLLLPLIPPRRTTRLALKKSAQPYIFSCLYVYKTISLPQTSPPSFLKDSPPRPVIAFALPELLGGKPIALSQFLTAK